MAVINPNNDLYLVDQDNGTPILIGSNIINAEFSADGGSLLYNSPYDIYTYSIGDKTKNLITRLAQKVETASWYKDYEHIWFVSDNTIKNIEIDSRPIINVIDFKKLSAPVQNFTYDANANMIYYYQLNNGALSIHQLAVGN